MGGQFEWSSDDDMFGSIDRCVIVAFSRVVSMCLCVCYISLMQWEHQCVQANPSKPKGYKIFSKMVNWTERSKSVRVNAHTPACLTTNYGLYAANEIDSRHLIMDKLIVTKSVDTHKKNRRTRAHDKHSNQIKIQQIHSNHKPMNGPNIIGVHCFLLLLLFPSGEYVCFHYSMPISHNCMQNVIFGWFLVRSPPRSARYWRYNIEQINELHTLYTSHSPKYKHFTSTLMMLRNEYEPLTHREKLNS